MAALLRAIMYQAIFTDVEVSRPGATTPLVGPAFGNVVLKPVEARVMVLLEILHLQKDFAFDVTQRLELPLTVVNDADCGGEAKLHCAAPHHQRVMRIVNTAADNRVYVDVKVGVLGQQLQLLIQHLQRLLGHVVRHHIVNADLQMVEPGAVQALDAVGGEQIAVGDNAGDDRILAHVSDDVIQFRMQQRLATAEGDNHRSQTRQFVNPALHCFQRNRLGEIVELVAVGARKIAAANRDYVRQDGPVGGGQPIGDHLPFSSPAFVGY